MASKGAGALSSIYLCANVCGKHNGRLIVDRNLILMVSRGGLEPPTR
jgi:hypothetical protein